MHKSLVPVLLASAIDTRRQPLIADPPCQQRHDGWLRIQFKLFGEPVLAP